MSSRATRRAVRALLRTVPRSERAPMVAAVAAWLRALSEASWLLRAHGGRRARRTALRLAESADSGLYDTEAVTYRRGRVFGALSALWFNGDPCDEPARLGERWEDLAGALEDIEAAR